jgi:predicted RNA binding protein YcfA (HicA-like mRNA interferase family)
MSKIIRIKDLKYILSALGYMQEKTAGTHIVYKHPTINSCIIFQGRKANSSVPKIVFSAIIKNIINSNVADEKKIQKVIAAVATPHNHPTTIKTTGSPALYSPTVAIKRETNTSNRANKLQKPHI